MAQMVRCRAPSAPKKPTAVQFGAVRITRFGVKGDSSDGMIAGSVGWSKRTLAGIAPPERALLYVMVDRRRPRSNRDSPNPASDTRHATPDTRHYLGSAASSSRTASI